MRLDSKLSHHSEIEDVWENFKFHVSCTIIYGHGHFQNIFFIKESKDFYTFAL